MAAPPGKCLRCFPEETCHHRLCQCIYAHPSVNYAAPDSVRFTALKDMLLSTQVLFDLLFTGETYRLLVRDDKGEQSSQGTVTQFAQAYPTFRTFFLVGEAFFLPGFDGQGQP